MFHHPTAYGGEGGVSPYTQPTRRPRALCPCLLDCLRLPSTLGMCWVLSYYGGCSWFDGFHAPFLSGCFDALPSSFPTPHCGPLLVWVVPFLAGRFGTTVVCASCSPGCVRLAPSLAAFHVGLLASRVSFLFLASCVRPAPPSPGPFIFLSPVYCRYRWLTRHSTLS